MSKRRKKTHNGKRDKITISDIAEMANVGVATVSRVLNDSPKVSAKTAARVRRVLKRTNYRPAYAAQALARGKTNTIELLYNTAATKLSQDPVLLSILDAAHHELQRAHYRLAFSAMKTDFQKLPPGMLQEIENGMADGALLVSCKMTDTALRALRGLPVVLLDHHGNGMVCSVTNNHYRAMRESVAMLAERGHRRIAYIASESSNYNEAMRYAAYRDEMAERGLSRRPEWELHTDTVTEQVRAMFASSEPPTAVLTTTTVILPQLFELLEAKGLEVPQDLSLLTVDSAPEASTALTGLVRPVSRHYLQWDMIVHTAMEELFARIADNQHIRHIELPVPFRDEGTVAPLPTGRS